MPSLQPQQVKEINSIIEEIEKAIKPKHEIGAQSKAILKALLKAQNIKKSPLFFATKREYSDQIVAHFVQSRKLVRNKFHSNGQDCIFLL